MLRTLHQHDGTTRKVHLGGWKKQHVDQRDEAFRIKLHGSLLSLAAMTDLRSFCSPIEDQGELGSCTANMFAGLIEFNELRRQNSVRAGVLTVPSVVVGNIVVNADGSFSYNTTVTSNTPPPAPNPPTPPAPPTPKTLIQVSRLFEYYGTRKIEGTVSEDSGATIRDAIKCGVRYGVADESAWPYDISKFTIRPPDAIWTAAATHKVTSYHSIADGDLQTMKSTIALGFPIGFGFQVYDYFMSAAMSSKGFLHRPTPSESLQGGHAVCLVGYDDSKQAFIVRNSWGTSWGLTGYFYMAYDYVQDTSLASDFWVVQSSPI